MTKETYKQATEILEKQEILKDQIRDFNTAIDDEKGGKVRLRVRGMALEVPKGTFKAQMKGRRDELQSQLTLLENEFNAL